MDLMFPLILWNLLFPFGAILFGMRVLFSRRRGLLRSIASELPERLGLIRLEKQASAASGPLWIHAASLGEVNAALPLIEGFRAAGRPLILTSTNRAGVERARSLGLPAALAPLDCYVAVKAFLARARPAALILVETEFWPQTIALASAKGLPIVVVNASISQRSFARYGLIRPLMKRLLSRLQMIAAQTPEDAERFKALGARETIVAVVGNLKYDLKPVPKPREAAEAIKALGWKNAPIFVAGSTHPEEEDAVLEGYLKSLERLPELRLVIAPRHVERAGSLAASLRGHAIPFRSYSGVHQRLPVAPRALLLDARGLLPQFYGLALASFVGGTLNELGGHNILEPAASGSPVLFGPHVFNVRAPAQALHDAQGGFEVRGAAEIAERLFHVFRHPELRERALEAARSLSGATRRTMQLLAGVLRESS